MKYENFILNLEEENITMLCLSLQSIAFHENGKRHKENVAKRLSEISKKSAQDAKHKVQMDKDFKKMEEVCFLSDFCTGLPLPCA